MKVFLSWSGEPSQRVAQALRRTLPLMLQHIETWGSFADIQPGARWASNIAYELQRAEFAIVCVTPENLHSDWISFELGALLKTVGPARICPYLIGFSPADLRGPLVQFQAVEATEQGTRRLIQSLNAATDPPSLNDAQLRNVFEHFWPAIAQAIQEALQRSSSSRTLRQQPPIRPERELLEEILGKLAQASPDGGPAMPASPQFVFLVHGRATAMAESVARYVEKLGPKVVILQEQPDAGRTVIEKFEDNADVAFAIVLMTGDDRGGLKNVPLKKQMPRARQNVVLELGYFVARIGRKRVLVLNEGGIELPSDYTGVLYVPLDEAGAWRLSIARELRAAGLAVDLNKAL